MGFEAVLKLAHAEKVITLTQLFDRTLAVWAESRFNILLGPKAFVEGTVPSGVLSPINKILVIERLKKALRKRLLYVLAVLLIVIITAAPEVAVFYVDLVLLLDALGAELFLLCFAVGARLYVTVLFYSLRAFIEQLDRYFFIPARHQIVGCPGISVHAIPGYISLYFFAIYWPCITVDA